MSLEGPYDHKKISEKWLKYWEKEEVYKFDRKDKTRPTYSIDTPPPYPSGEFHVGNALNWAYFDFVARYKRMRGYNVHFPQGWDCHGLPTEVRLERELGKRKSEFPPDEFIKLSREYTLKWIKPMKESIKKLGCSIDWSLEYLTMDPDYWRRTQLSFIKMYQKGLVYRDIHPVFWCPRCETAIAEAEVEYEDMERELYYIKFVEVTSKKEVDIATTRPELLSACVAVAVNPNDERYTWLIGHELIVPIYDTRVKVLADASVDPEFGSGVVMICTYGDKTDVKWQKVHNLPIRIVIDSKGHFTDNAGFLKGLSIKEGREKIIKELSKRGLISKIEKTVSEVGTCWRCHTPIEILPRPQWFVKVMDLTDNVLEWAEKIRWVPEHAKKMLIDWVLSLDWDWVISRQRLFATPIPVWYCENCGEIIVAKPEWLPIDPRREKPRVPKCPRCGSSKFKGEKDVMDTWMDSSITCAVHAGWPDDMDPRLFPADLQPNGYDIIRTWDYYLLVRHIALFGVAPYKTVLINGMVWGADGRMMSKSYGNYVVYDEVHEKYGPDAFRFWIASAVRTGSDLRIRWNDIDYNRRFMIKIWNAAKFVYMNIKDYDPKNIPQNLRLIDRWILSLMNKLIIKVTEAMENFDFMEASVSLREFTWHKFCDHYLEAIKHRLWNNKDAEAAKYTLYKVLLNIILMLAPIAPYITEEIYQNIYRKHLGYKSVHIAPWPVPEKIIEDDLTKGDILISTIAALRRAKSSLRIPLSAMLDKVIIYTSKYYELLNSQLDDIRGTIRIKEVELIKNGKGKFIVKNYPEISFTILLKKE